jgi:hypothetical protein
MQGLFINRNQ